jgi:hypothetical protein
MHPTKLTPVLALVLIAAVALAQYPYARPEPLVVAGTKPTVLYGNCYPNACVGTLMPDHWPFGGTPPQALVAIGSPAFGDYYSLTNQFAYLDLAWPAHIDRWFRGPIIPGNITSGLRKLSTGIGIGFTALGEFAATLNNGIGGGLALARYNTATADLQVTETWTTNRFDYINPADWLNGWTLSANLTIKDGTNLKNYWIFLHAFAVYSNRTHAGGGRGVAMNLTIGDYGNAPRYPPTKWRLLPFTSSDIKPFTIVYDSPRLLIATGGVRKQVDLSQLKPELMGAYVIIDVSFTLIFPKAWPYAIVYYNYSVTANIASKLLPFPMYLNSTAFSIRFEIDQVNGAPAAGTYNATIFTPTSCGGREYSREYTLLHATPYNVIFRNITMFAAVYPKATEFTPLKLGKLIPYRSNNFDIVLPTGYRKATLASEGGREGEIPFVILQWSSGTLDPNTYKSVAGTPVTYKGGVMFIYGYAYNITNWAAARQPDPYIRALVERTIFHLPSLSPAGCGATVATCSFPFRFRIGVAGSMADPTDVLALGYVADVVEAPWYGLDIAPGAFQNLYTGSNTTGIYKFTWLRFFGGLPVVLAKLSNTFPYFYDRYYRFAFSKTFMVNLVSVVGGSATFTVGGPVVNMLTRYTQDFAWYAPFIHNYKDVPFPFAFDKYDKYYVACSSCIGSLFTTVWNTARLFTANNTWPPITDKKTVGYAIISTAVDPNGTVILQIWGANAQDTYFAGKLLRDQPNSFNAAPAYIIVFEYNYATPLFVTANVYKLSTIESPKLVGTFRLAPSGNDVKFQ